MYTRTISSTLCPVMFCVRYGRAVRRLLTFRDTFARLGHGEKVHSAFFPFLSSLPCLIVSWLGSCLLSLICPCPYFSCFFYAHLLFFAHWFWFDIYLFSFLNFFTHTHTHTHTHTFGRKHLLFVWWTFSLLCACGSFFV